jgi:murein DD-endopeptidase MepM/ murein hydrolase activator NlpD
MTVKRRDTVSQGQQIARVGYSGLERAYGAAKAPRAAHLHFEIRVNGKPQDPEPFLTQKSSSDDLLSEEGPPDNLNRKPRRGYGKKAGKKAG